MFVRCCQLYNCDSEKRRASKRVLTRMLLENYTKNSDTSMQGTDREPHAPQPHPTASRQLHPTASAASSSCCRCDGWFRACSCRNCRRLTSSLTSSHMLNVVLLRKLQRGHAVALPLREGIRNHAVGHPATLGTQGLHAPSEHAKPFSRTAAMTTTGFSNQMVKGTLGVNNAHTGLVEMITLSAFMTVTIGWKLN